MACAAAMPVEKRAIDNKHGIGWIKANCIEL